MTFQAKNIIVAFSISLFSVFSWGQNTNNFSAAHLDELQKELNELLIKYTEQHPNVIALKNAITEAKQQRQSKNNQLKPVAKTDGSSLQIRTLKAKLNELLTKLTEQHPDVVKLKLKINELEQNSQQSAMRRQQITKSLLSEQEKQPLRNHQLKLLHKSGGKKRNTDFLRTPIINFWEHGILKVPIIVKETAGVGAEQYPTTAVIPLPYGAYQDTEEFRLVDANGNNVPAQFSALNRWWYRDNSIRHLMISFQPTVSTFSAPGSGTTTYYLKDDGFKDDVKTPLTIQENETQITVVTGPIKFFINKKSFNILDEVWFDRNQNNIFEEAEKVILSARQNGGVFQGRLPDDLQLDSSRDDVSFEIEEAGPMRAVIKAQALTKYFNPEHHVHGYAVRIYAYANKPFIKIDYQLQNSAKNTVFSWPLYFKEMTLNFKLNLEDNPTVKIGLGDNSVYQRSREKGLYLAQEFHDKFGIYDMAKQGAVAKGKISSGFIDVRDSDKGVAGFIRYFWQTWPNGLAIGEDDNLQLQLFPSWSSHWRQGSNWRQGRNMEKPPAFTDTGLYWLIDMQHVYKEALLYFHNANITDSELVKLSQTFTHHPVATLPTQWYKETAVTLDLSGLIPLDNRLPEKDLRINSYDKYDFDVKKSTHYNFGWDQFLLDIHRKTGPGQGGGWPYSVSAFIATENPSDYYFAEQFAIGELNVRPQWLAQYKFGQDWKRLQLTPNPYSGWSWRKIKGGNYEHYFDAPFLPGTNHYAKPRDDAHAWFYHMEEAYYFTANPWIKDWYQFIGEFRKTFLNHLDPFPDAHTRAKAHALANALQAYRVTGDITLIEQAKNYINTWLRKEQNPFYGGIEKREKDRERASWIGYLSRSVIAFMEEVKDKDKQAYAEAFNLLSGMMEWNLVYGQFGIISAKIPKIGSSNYTSQNMADPQAWYYWHTGKRKYFDQLVRYAEKGINNDQPKGRLPDRAKNWTGGFQGRWVQHVFKNEKTDITPPEGVSDLKAIMNGAKVKLEWTAPKEAVRYHIVWSEKPISEKTTTDTNVINWWAANPIGPDILPKPGEKQSVVIEHDRSKAFYAAMFSFDKNDNMSLMSNLANPQASALVDTR